MNNLFAFFDRWTAPLLSGRYWKSWVAGLCVLYCILTSLPNYFNLTEQGLKRSPYYAVRLENLRALSQQMDHPFQPVITGNDSHSSKLAFRFVPALLVGLAPTQDLYVRAILLYLLNNVAGFVFFFALLAITFGYAQNRLFAALVAFNVSVLYVGKSFFHDTYLWNDGLAFAFLLVSVWSRHPFGTLLCLLAAYFTDERAIFGAVLAFVFYILSRTNDLRTGFLVLVRQGWPFGASLVGYGLIRWLLTQTTPLATPVGQESGVALFLRFGPDFYPWVNMLGLFMIYKAAWVPVLWSVGQLKNRLLLLACTVGGLLLVVVTAFSVGDLSRSLAYSFMALVSAFFLYHERAVRTGNTRPERALLPLLLINFLLPSVSIVLNDLKWLPPIDRLIDRFL